MICTLAFYLALPANSTRVKRGVFLIKCLCDRFCTYYTPSSKRARKLMAIFQDLLGVAASQSLLITYACEECVGNDVTRRSTL